MVKKIIFLCHILILVCAPVFCEFIPFDLRHQQLNLESVTVFKGDMYGDFKDDLVANLNDGSAWKVHPGDQDLICQWNPEDSIFIRLRTSFYWFKREHKFELYNESREEALRVMLVKFPEIPLYITSSEIHISGYHMSFYTTTDGFGNVHYHYYPVYEYATIVKLSDGSEWNIDEYCRYNVGEKGYVFLDRNSSMFILITQIERNAVWKKIMLKSLPTHS